MKEYLLTKEVAEVLDVSVPTVRNYAKALEKYNHEFQKRKQARLWTNTEISIIREVQDLYNNNDYSLDTCFQYIIAKRKVGEEKAKELLVTPLEGKSVEYNSQLDAVEKNLLDAINSLKEDLTPYESLSDNQDRLDELETVREENKELKKIIKKHEDELEYLKTLNMWQFRKWRQENN